MSKKPEYRVTKRSGESGSTSTVGRHTTGDAAAQARLGRRGQLPKGSSDDFTVNKIKHRGGR